MIKTILFSALLSTPLLAHTHTEAVTPAIPVLESKSQNAIFGLKVEGPCVIKGLKLDLTGTTSLDDIEALEIYSQDKETPDYRKMKLYHKLTDLNQLSVKKDLTFGEGTHYLWVSIDIKKSTDISNKFAAKITELQLADETIQVNATSRIQRVGVNVRDTGDDKAKGYRIPGIVTSNKGTLLSVYDIRFDSARDLQGHMDVGLSRSTDGGQTWGPMKSIIDMGTYGGLPEKFNGVSDACILVDKNTGHIFVAGCWMHGLNDNQGNWIKDLDPKSNHHKHQWNGTGSMPGLSPKGTCQFLMVKSEDDGLTWSKPVNLTKTLKKTEWHLFAPAPGRGITMSDGTLVMPTQGRDEKSKTFSNFIYSKDGGKSWKVSNFAKSDTTECQIAELSDGSLMLNMRDNRNYYSKDIPESGRAVHVTKDLGKTWTEHPTSRKTLPEPVCCAGLLKHTFKTKRDGLPQSILIFSNPPNKTKKGGRNKITIKVSLDDGMTWPEEYHLLLDTYKGAYSCLTSVDDDHIGILYEGSRSRICFQKIAIKDLLTKEK